MDHSGCRGGEKIDIVMLTVRKSWLAKEELNPSGGDGKRSNSFCARIFGRAVVKVTVLKGGWGYLTSCSSTTWAAREVNELAPTLALSLRVTSMRLAYQELQLDRKKEEKKLQNLEGKKREQAERLGMGLVSRRYLAVDGIGQTGVLEVPCSRKEVSSLLL